MLGVIVDLARTGRLSPARVAELEAKVARAVGATRAVATLRAYRADWADFTVWCQMLGVEPLPAAPAVLAAYLSELAQPGDDRRPAAVATIERRLSAIAQAHRVAGLASPRRDPLVAETLRGVRRLLGVAPQGRKAGALTADIKAAVAAIDLDTRAECGTGPCCWWASRPGCAAASWSPWTSKTSRPLPRAT